MKSFAKKIGFLIDLHYAGQVKNGKVFNPLLQPSLIGLYILGIVSKLFSPSSTRGYSYLPQKSKLMRFLGHSFFPNKHSISALTDQEISIKQVRFSEDANPKVTFIIICGKSTSSLAGLLKSIAANSLEAEIELVFLTEEGKKDIGRFLKSKIKVAPIYYVSESVNFLTTLNSAVANSKGEFFSVLSPSVLLQPNWLKEMVKEISKDQNIGIVSGKILSSDGLLDEAGTFISADFYLYKYGRWDLPGRPKYNFIREIECTSGVNSLVRKVDFDRAGGFEVRANSLAEAFCQLSFTFSKNFDKKIKFIPQAEMIKLENGGNEKYDVSKFSNQSSEELAIRSSEEDHNARLLITSKTILFIDIGLPEPDRDSGSLRATYLLKMMIELGYHVIVVPRKGQVASPYFEDLISLGLEVVYAFPDRKGMEKELKSLLPSVSIAWICRPQLNSEFEWIFQVNPKMKWVFDTIDLHYVRLAREAALVKNKKLAKKSARFKKLELSIAYRADLTLTVTADEMELLNEQGIKNVAVIPNVHESHQLAEYPSFSEREGLVFIGSYHHPPNVDAVQWLVEEIMPIVWKELRIPVTLLGNAPTKEVKALECDLVKVPGYVEDITPFFSSHRVFVAPLRYGAGMKGKIGQSLAYKLPIVTTNIGAEGVGLTHMLDVLIAEDKESFAKQIIKVYQDEQLWRELGSNSENVLRSYSPDHIKQNLSTMLEGLY